MNVVESVRVQSIQLANLQPREAQQLRPVQLQVSVERQPEEAHEGGGECCWRGNDWRWLTRIGWHTAAKLLPAPAPRALQ